MKIDNFPNEVVQIPKIFVYLQQKTKLRKITFNL